MESKNQYIFSIVSMSAAWGFMTFLDYLQETFNYEFSLFPLHIPVIVILISYMIVMHKSRIEFSFSNQVQFMFCFLAIGLLFACIIIYMVDKNIWFIKQGEMDTFLDFNGIEYLFFAVVLILGCEAGFLIHSFLAWTFRH